MVDASRAFQKEPPRRPLDTLEAIWEDFQWRYKERKKTDQVIDFCRRADTFAQAVRRAVEARDENGKHHNHQSKVDLTARRKFGNKIIARHTRGSLDVVDFDAMHDVMDSIKPFGIGPVTVYDVAVRVGAYLGIEPQSVYLHAGVRQGLKALIGALSRTGDNRSETLWEYQRQEKVPLSVFPPPLNRLSADDVEDLLCTYRGVFDWWGEES